MMGEKIIRDPVHDVIAFRLDSPTDALLFRLVSAREVQRLRRIRQLGMTALAYPGADHTRYSHSLGVMETARRIVEQLGRSTALDESMKTVCFAAALLHDVGHGPFSHVFERVSGIEHERLTRQVILDPESEVHGILKAFDAQLPGRVADLVQGEAPDRFWSDVLASQLDADRFDYLLRDNLMTGSRYGGFDLRWVLHALSIDPATRRLTVTWKGVSAVEAYLQSRFHMYRNVYFHKVVRGAEGMVKLALRRARRLAVQGRLEWPPREHVVYKALLGQRLSIEEFTDLDDTSVLHCFKLWTRSADGVLARLCHGLLFRRLYKSIDLSRIEDPARLQAIIASAHHAVREAGGDEDGYDLFYDEPVDTPYETFDPDHAADEILVREPGGRLVAFGEVSPISQALGRQLMFRRLHVAEPFRDTARRAVERAIEA